MRVPRPFVMVLCILALTCSWPQETPKPVHLTDHLKVPISVNEQPLSAFTTALSAQTKIAICLEDVDSGASGSLANLAVTLSSAPGTTLREVLDRFHDLYPQVGWTVDNGIIILRAAPLKELRNTPLDAKAVTEVSLTGNVDAIKGFLAGGIPGFRPAIIETKGAIHGPETYELKIKAGMTAREVLVALTRKYGLEWYAEIRVDRLHNHAENGPAKVSIRLHGGSNMPAEVLSD